MKGKVRNAGTSRLAASTPPALDGDFVLIFAGELMADATAFQRYNQFLCKCPGSGVQLDLSKSGLTLQLMAAKEADVQAAFDAMAALEGGSIANPDEQRMVGHYWLRAPSLAPEELQAVIQAEIDHVKAFAEKVHGKEVAPPSGGRYTDVLIVGIGGSALGPQLIADALSGLGGKRALLKLRFLDNTDPDGIARELKDIGSKLKSTLVITVSKSGGTPETRNGMLEVQRAFKEAGLDFAKQAVAVTGEGSKLDAVAKKEGWVERFPMWDWVGGRTSITATVGLLPAALLGVKIDDFLAGAAKMDELTRERITRKNPAAMLALAWYQAGNGKGEKDMVILPYKDRLLLFARYLQQLVMESLGKEKDLNGEIVHQGIAVYGNKGSTDQHAYVQQLREGVHNFFATFIVVMQDNTRSGVPSLEVEPGISTGDYLNGFWLGTRAALEEAGRSSISLVCDKLDARTLGALIALYERAVGIYALLVNINAYHQPGVEAGKKAAAAVLELQTEAVAYLKSKPKEAFKVEDLAQALGKYEQAETLLHVLEHLSANKRFVHKKGKTYQYKA